ncbi:MAG: metallophosphoesterase [Bauldia sp.]|nr:metallophosphoesterase [Bauldia sp.]
MIGYTGRATAAAILVTVLAVLPQPTAAGPSGRFAVVSDIHFDPFDPEGLAATLATLPPDAWMGHFASLPPAPASQYGKDTNHVLLRSAIGAIGAQAAAADFAIVGGDLLSHGFEDDTAKALGVPLGSAAQREFAVRTTQFVAGALGAAFEGRPVIVALGNNDSDCGDYEIEPGGGYLAAIRETIRALAGPDRVAADFDATFAAGGYYALRHPTVAGTRILVINDVLWSERYRNACGADGLAAGHAEMAWLATTLDAMAEAGQRAWIVHHIPWGIDPYATLHAKAETCPARVVPFMQAEFADTFLALLRRHAGIIDVSLSGHVHFDDYRLLLDDTGAAASVDKVVPAISPIFGQNPAFQLFTYDRENGRLRDFSTVALMNLPALGPGPGDWRETYVFTKAYDLPGFSAESVARLWNGLGQGGTRRTAYLANYNAGHGNLAQADLDAYACAIAALGRSGYAACLCGE